MPAGRTSGGLRAREILQVLIVGFGWVGFVWLWVLVGRQPWDSRQLVWLIVGSLVVLPIVTLAWVTHNRAIFKRKGERLGVPKADSSYAKDWHGRSVDADWMALRTSRLVTVGVVGPVKTYRSIERVHPPVASAGVPARTGTRVS